jgi:SAM-dependent methyltransferase
LEVQPLDRDAWLDVVLGPDELCDDGAALPRGCVPYLPCAVDALLRVVDQAPVGAADVFIDIGSGTGRALSFVHLLTGATAIGVEIQPELVRAARERAARLRLSRLTTLEGDATSIMGAARSGSVFFLYCPFSGERLVRLLGELERLARERPLRICAVDVPLPEQPWLVMDPPGAGDLCIFRSSAAS